jgi:hypothetical protein
MRSEIVSSLSRGLVINGRDPNEAVLVVGEESFRSVGCIVDDCCAGELSDVVGGVCVAARLSCDILRNFDINFRTG